MTCCRSEEKHSARTDSVFCLIFTGTMLVMKGALNPKPSGRNRSAAFPRVTLMPRVPGSTTYEVEELRATARNSSNATPISLGRNTRCMLSAEMGGALRGGIVIGCCVAQPFQVLQSINHPVAVLNHQRSDSIPFVDDL